MNIITGLLRRARANPDAVLVRCGDDTLTAGQFVERSGRLAAFFLAQGLMPGDRVGICLPNDPHWVPTWAGILQAGGTAVPINVLISPTALQHVVSDSGMRWVITRPQDLARVNDLLASSIGSGEVRLMSTERAEGASISLEDLPPTLMTAVVPRLDDTDAMIMYTSGSTGVPKGVRQTHRNTSSQCEAVEQVYDLTSADHALVCTPLFHVGGLQLILLPVLLAGGSVTLMRKWDKGEWIERSLAMRPTVTALVPTMMIDIANACAEKPITLDSYRVCMVGGSALPPGPLKRFNDSTGITCIRTVYGQTEQNGLCSTEPADETPRYLTMGKPLAQIIEWQVVDLDIMEPVAHGSSTVGELWVRGDALTPGYWNNPRGSAERFLDGWFRTGDMVTVDGDGYLYFADRADDMIISGGENVFPQVVENAMSLSPLISEVSVIGTPHERYVHQVTAIVVPAKPEVTIEDIAAWCREHPDLQGLQSPRRIEIVEQLPRTPNNKVDRMALRKLFSSSLPGR
ncbi:MAG: AMP-binding protein [Actinobacteria bacterium]|uniref:Unannotated protein n=1 Tax=freshwater metagenome TaxID=449393 RepID=A0A6J7REB9_9ZZZZ|nr:AMP-binding protein [Actinomycetota bacterium]